jgi:hypothetical protein
MFFLGFCLSFPATFGCGKKGPPVLPDRELPFYVQRLKADMKNGTVFLTGNVVAPEIEEGSEAPLITGCRVYSSCFALNAAPCEGCPIDYKLHKELRWEGSGEDFECKLMDISEKGIYFFKVRLLGPNHAIGPPSNQVKLIIDENL